MSSSARPRNGTVCTKARRRGGWGPSKYNGVFLNDGNTLSFIEPGSTENRQWNEDNITLAATLGDIAVLEPTGIYGDLELGEGATLTSDGTMAMPIFGALKGTGTLAGSFAFAGEHNSWHVEGVNNNRELASAKFAAPTRATFLGLKEVKAEFDAKPVCSDYFLTDSEVPDLVEADLADVKATVTAGNKDYSSSFSVGIVRAGREGDCPPQFQIVANVEMLPVPMLPISNWSLELDIGNTGNISK